MATTNSLFIYNNTSVLDALKKMDNIRRKLLIVVDESNKYINLISIGDIQRAIIDNKGLETPISEVFTAPKTVASDKQSFEEIKQMMLKIRCEFMPVISSNQTIKKLYFWEDVFDKSQNRKKAQLNLPVIVMAGGKGSRLKPITNVLPKPLIPINEKTIIEEIMDRFVVAGCSNFYISVNYKAEMIKHFFEQLNNEDYHISYFQEEKPLGTAGSIFLIKNKINSTFFVSNCDIILDLDLSEVYKYHRENKNIITIVSALKHYKIPYGTIKTSQKGQLQELIEKPELTFQINAGLYLLEPECLDYIPENTFFHITELIEKLKYTEKNIGVFPVSQGSWTDIGQWNEYLKLINE